MRSAQLDGKWIVLAQKYNPQLIAEIKELPKRKWNGDDKTWRVPVEYAIQVIEFAQARGYAISSDLLKLHSTAHAQHVKKEAASVILAELSNASHSDLTLDGFGVDLYPFQRAGVEFALRSLEFGGVMIGDEMGLGKTRQALGVIHAMNLYPALIVSPASIRLNWQREAANALANTDKTVALYPKHGDVTIVTYDMLSRSMTVVKKGKREHRELSNGLGREFALCVLDESHYIKNGKAKRTHAALTVNARHKIALTGTPILNRPVELWSQLEYLGRAKEFGGWYDFTHRYCAAKRGPFGWDVSGASNLLELNEKMRSSFYIRRDKADVLKELPPITRQAVYIETDPKGLKHYRNAEADIIAWLRDNVSKIAADRAMRAKALVELNRLRSLSAEIRMDGTIKYIKELADMLGDGKIVVFATHVDVVQAIAKALDDAPIIAGGVPLELRQKAVDDFQNDDTVRFIVLNLASGAEGITLTASNHLVFAEMGWNPGKHQQAEARIHRIGQEADKVIVQYCLTEDKTLDHWLFSLIASKSRVTNALASGRDQSDEFDTASLGALIEYLTK